MIDLNDKKYQVGRITKEDLIGKYSEEAIFRHYVGDFELGVPMRSPIRKGDETPSFNIFYSKKNNCLLFKDFAGKRGDFVKLVQELLGIVTYQEALDRISQDLNSNVVVQYKPIVEKVKTEHTYNSIRIVVRPWTRPDLEYWLQYGISYLTLRLYNVYPIEGYYNNTVYIDTPDPTFAYVEYKDSILTYKIYRPYADKKNKWRNNNPFGVHQGYTQLPKGGDLLIITKSLKDVMSLYENAKISSVGIQSETCFMKQSVVDEYKNRFNFVVCLFDNDRQGVAQSLEYKKLYDIDHILIPEKYLVKDFSDLVKIVGKYNAVGIIKSELYGRE